MKVQRSTEMLHPLLKGCVNKIQGIISLHNIPIRLFETGRSHDRHQMLLQKGKTKDVMSPHLYNLQNDPVLYATAVEYVYYDKGWSWNLRDSTVMSWYLLFGNIVLDTCPILKWGADNRKGKNYCFFELKQSIIREKQRKYPCVIY